MIILDVYINGVANGRELCRIIKSLNDPGNIPIILMSANSEGLKNFEECRADAIIEKPFNLLELLQILDSLLNLNFKNTSIIGKINSNNYTIKNIYA